MNKQFMGNVTVTPIGSPFTTAGWIGATARHTNGTIMFVIRHHHFKSGRLTQHQVQQHLLHLAPVYHKQISPV